MADAASSVHFEDLLEHTGWGLYYKFMVGLFGICCFTQGALTATFIFSCALFGCDFLYSEKNMVSIYISFLLGSCLGGGSMNVLCDRYGRKKLLCYSHILCFLISFVIAFSYSYYIFLVIVAILGIGIEMNVCTSKLCLAEILPKRSRGCCLVFCDIFWTFGFMTLACYAIFTHNATIISDKPNELRLTNWRIMYAISGGLALLIGCTSALLEESPRYFLHVRKNYLAYLVLKQFYAINKSSYAGNFQVKENEVDGLIERYDLPLVEERSNNCVVHFCIRSIIESVGLLFSTKRFLFPLLLLIAVKIPILLVSVSTLHLVLEKQLSLNTTAIESTIYRGVQLIYPSTYKENESPCELNLDNSNFFMIVPVVACGQIITMILIDVIGRKPLIYIGFLMGSICFISLTLVQTYILKLINSLILMVCIGCLVSSISVVNIECFPTAVRGSAHGVTNFFGYLASILFIAFGESTYRNLNITLGTLYFCTSIFCIFLPEMKKRPMVE